MTIKIDQKIVGYSVKLDADETDASTQLPEEKPPVETTIPKRLRRPDILNGTTLRIKANGFNIYMTVNCDPATSRPLELFFSSSHLESMAWVALATRLSSLILQSYDQHINNLGVLAREYIETEIPEPMMAKVWGEKKPRNHHGIIQLIGRNLLAFHKAFESNDQVVLKEAIASPDELDEQTTDSNFPPCNECGGEIRLMDGCLTCTQCGDSKCG